MDSFRVGKFLALTRELVHLLLRPIAISNLDGLGFKQGVRITESRNDDTMSMLIRPVSQNLRLKTSDKKITF